MQLLLILLQYSREKGRSFSIVGLSSSLLITAAAPDYNYYYLLATDHSGVVHLRVRALNSLANLEEDM